ncbi:MAG: hypothetical protein MRY32_05190 [Rickettsiales bacterium]|nr:hypothetical protein [Rickettsiales bacterium]
MRVFYQVLFGVTIIGALSSPASAGGITIHFGDGVRSSNAWSYFDRYDRGYRNKYRKRNYYKRRAKLKRRVIPCTFTHQHSHYEQPRRGRLNGRRISTIRGF